MSWRIRVRCLDCFGVDSAGCFDGGAELLDTSYPTRQAAEAAAEEMNDGAPYAYEIVEGAVSRELGKSRVL